MWTKEQAIERLQHMEARPRMYADCKESFVMQVITILESMECCPRSSDLLDAAFPLNPTQQAEYERAAELVAEVTDDWAKKFMVHAWDMVQKNEG